MHFSLGSGSAARHASAAKAERTRVEIVDDPAFQRDVDVPQDLAWLCRIGINCTTVDYLRETGLDALVRQMFPEALAS
jgi:2-phospho-L-lactate guanylyltransferase (CobY/MobA/RfbA family)